MVVGHLGNKNMKKITAGIIGYNEGNGHPYSFSAIINGFNQDENWSRYPQILQYLKSNQQSSDNIFGLEVTHIYTPNNIISDEISKCSKIKNVVQKPEDLLNKVDLILILTDEGDQHWKLAKYFLTNKTPVFIDKPLCNNLNDLIKFKPFLLDNTLMSCSGFIYHPSVNEISKKGINSNGFTIGKTRLDWFKYGIHLLEPICLIHKSKIIKINNIKNEKENDIILLEFENGSYSIIIRDNSTDKFMIDIHSQKLKIKNIVFDDNYFYFKNLINDIHKFANGHRVLTVEHTYETIYTLIKSKT